MRSQKVILEEIDDCEIEFQQHALAAKNVFDSAKRADRELTVAEKRSFDTAANSARHHKQKLQQLRAELEQSKNQQGAIIAMSQYPNGITTSNYQPERVLPTNGVLPGAERRYSDHARIGKLRNFKDEQLAFDGSQWVRAVVSRTHYGIVDRAAEEHCERVGLRITNVGTEGSGASGGYLVPSPLSAVIVDVRERVGVARQACRIMPCASDTLSVPRRDTGLTVYAPGEGNLITDSDKGWSQLELVLKKRAVAAYISQELAEDSIVNIVDDLFGEMGHALALEEDKELILGDGGSAFFGVQGLLSKLAAGGVATAASGHDTWGELDLADFAACVGKLPDRYFPYGPAWICSHAFFNAAMARLAFAAGGVSMAEVMSSSPATRTFMGYPVFLTSQMPTSSAAATVCCLFGAYTQCALLGDRGGIRIARSDEYKFLEDKIALKATSRYDIKTFDGGTDTAPGAFVGLKTAS